MKNKKLLKRTSILLLALVLSGIFSPVKAYIYDMKADGGNWSFGVGTFLNLWFRQESKYYHPTKKHYTNAMMNNKYSGRVYAAKGKYANAYTQRYFGGWKSNRSYYGF